MNAINYNIPKIILFQNIILKLRQEKHKTPLVNYNHLNLLIIKSSNFVIRN